MNHLNALSNRVEYDDYKHVYDPFFGVFEALKSGEFVSRVEKEYLSRTQRRLLRRSRGWKLEDQMKVADFMTGWLGAPPAVFTSLRLWKPVPAFMIEKG